MLLLAEASLAEASLAEASVAEASVAEASKGGLDRGEGRAEGEGERGAGSGHAGAVYGCKTCSEEERARVRLLTYVGGRLGSQQRRRSALPVKAVHGDDGVPRCHTAQWCL